MKEESTIRKKELSYKEYKHWSKLEKGENTLLESAWNETKNAYAPYSQFRVGACAELENGVLVPGSNQENASFPAGLCAERVALFSAMGNHPGVRVKKIAITAVNRDDNLKRPVFPCGFCAQVLIDLEERQQSAIKIILGLKNGPAFELDSAKMLLPFFFSKSDL